MSYGVPYVVTIPVVVDGIDVGLYTVDCFSESLEFSGLGGCRTLLLGAVEYSILCKDELTFNFSKVLFLYVFLFIDGFKDLFYHIGILVDLSQVCGGMGRVCPLICILGIGEVGFEVAPCLVFIGLGVPAFNVFCKYACINDGVFANYDDLGVFFRGALVFSHCGVLLSSFLLWVRPP